MKRKKAGFLTKIVVLSLSIYAAATLISLQQQISDYTDERDALIDQVEAGRQKTSALEEYIENQSERDTVEDVAREKLGMVAPGEKLFIDVSN